VVPDEVVRQRLAELAEVQEPITAAARASLLGSTVEVLVDGLDDGVLSGRTHREAPEIDGVVRLGASAFARAGAVVRARVTGVEGPDLDAEPIAAEGAA
jgi:tRNA A37 methylthiotransferase MiaB